MKHEVIAALPNSGVTREHLGVLSGRGDGLPLSYEQFRYSFANEVGEDEAKELYPYSARNK